MSKTPCKGIRKDGSPCQGIGLKKYDGLCIAHGPAPDQVHTWRARGGKNSATAARLDKRLPERLKQAIDLVHDSMVRVLEGTISPAACNAACRSAKTLVDLYHRADEEMERIRTEETQAAAAEFTGAPANLDFLAAVDNITAQQDQYLAESLVEQGFAEYNEPVNPDQPSEVVLNDKGRHRFGYRNLDLTQQLILEMQNQFDEYDSEKTSLPDVHEITDLLETMDQDVLETQSRLASEPSAPFDPLTGKPFTKLPACVIVKVSPSRFSRNDETPQEVLADQRNEIKDLIRQAKELSEDEDYKRERAKIEKHNNDWDETMAYIRAKENNSPPLTTAPAVAVGA